MRVRFWGTRGSIATPGPSTNHFGGNTSCVEVTTDDGELFVFDVGTGARGLGQDLLTRGKSSIRGNILLTHTHWDHIQGFPFFVPAFIPGNHFAVYAPEGAGRSLHHTLAGQMEFQYFPVELSELPATMSYHDLTEGQHTIGGVRIFTHFLHHPTMTLGYRIEADGAAVVCMTDHEPFFDTRWRGNGNPGKIDSLIHEGDRRHASFMANADLVIHDAQYTPEEYTKKKNWGHSTFDYVVELAAAAGVRRLALTHHDPTHDDTFVAEIEKRARDLAKGLGSPMEVFCAFEGCDLALQPALAPGGSFVGPSTTRTTLAKARILITDDDQDMRALARRALERDGHVVMEAESGNEALRLVAEQCPDLIVLDLVMPSMSGMDVLKALRSQKKTGAIPVLIVTSVDDEVNTREGFDLGATDYLTKPYSMPQLAARVRSCLARFTESIDR